MTSIRNLLPEKVFNENIFKIILSKPVKSDALYIRAEILRNGQKYQASMYTEKQVFHSNHDIAGVKEFLSAHFGAAFLQYTAWDGIHEFSARVSKKEKVLTTQKRMAKAFLTLLN